ncbi:MAG: undecaprenyl/decaprenyl-phosphate alpha-N-acetylglucosaminyl 1-phosphate transferase [Deltaproteobacteria bacterium]|nr:undecaprenyl/decaprenyl-phosphate alpha-N-acetylglucosaminyl 1-phosphate transferase [Deltaproteobacteria bacterium]
MTAPLLAFFLAAILAVGVTPLVRQWARRVPAQPRGEHARTPEAGSETGEVRIEEVIARGERESVPRFGGLAVAVAFYVPTVALWLGDPGANWALARSPRVGLAFLLGGLSALALGARDDLRPLHPLAKLGGQLLIACGVVALGLTMQMLSVPGVGVLSLGHWAMPATVLWLVVVMNAVNLIDGLDGLASGVSLGIVAVLFVVSVLNGQPLGVIVGASLAGALLGFLRHNSHPASIFLGDSGSMFLGFVLAAWSVLAWQKSATGVAVVVLVVVFGLPLGDTLFAVVRRVAAGRKPWEADGGHIHHRLVGGGMSHRAAVYALYGVGVVLTLAAFVMLGLRG